MPLDLLSCMKSFSAVAEHQSFAIAARHTRVSTAVVTKQIQRLEEVVGKKLFERTTRRLQLTEAGRLYLCHAQKILKQVVEANSALINLETEPHGTVRVGIPGGFNSMFFSKQFQQFLVQYPKISLYISSESFPAIILDGYVDIVISSLNVHNKQLLKEKLLTVRRSVFAAPSYLEKHGTPKKIADLKQHNCLINIRSSPEHQWEFAKEQKIHVKGNYISESGADMIHAAVNGIGLLWTADILVKEEVAAQRLMPLEIGADPACVGLYLYYMPAAAYSPIKLLAEFLVSHTNTKKSLGF
jgi:LysR family transcriptional activator of dmlA